MKHETKSASSSDAGRATPHTGQHGKEYQAFGTVVPMPNGLSVEVSKKSVGELNQILADTMALRDLYKKHHWQVAGTTFYQLHLLFDKHYEEQSELVDAIAERIQLLGGVSLAMAADVAETTKIERPPRGRETVPVQLSRLLSAHEVILKEAHRAADQADEAGDHGTVDLLTSKIIPQNEFQVWFLSQHLVEVPVEATQPKSAVA
ncbi:MAG: DNA starvation/stationary phase protection protein [Acidobacteriota bacterium]